MERCNYEESRHFGIAYLIFEKMAKMSISFPTIPLGQTTSINFLVRIKRPILDANLHFQSCNRKYPLYSVIRRDCGNAKNMADT